METTIVCWDFLGIMERKRKLLCYIVGVISLNFKPSKTYHYLGSPKFLNELQKFKSSSSKLTPPPKTLSNGNTP